MWLLFGLSRARVLDISPWKTHGLECCVLHDNNVIEMVVVVTCVERSMDDLEWGTDHMYERSFQRKKNLVDGDFRVWKQKGKRG